MCWCTWHYEVLVGSDRCMSCSAQRIFVCGCKKWFVCHTSDLSNKDKRWTSASLSKSLYYLLAGIAEQLQWLEPALNGGRVAVGKGVRVTVPEVGVGDMKTPVDMLGYSVAVDWGRMAEEDCILKHKISINYCIKVVHYKIKKIVHIFHNVPVLFYSRGSDILSHQDFLIEWR